MKKGNSLIEEVKRVRDQSPIETADYYEITLLGSPDGTINRQIQTRFEGFTDTKPLREIRVASLIDPEKMRSTLRELGEPALIVNDDKDFIIFYLFGGHSIVETSLMKKYFPEFIKARVTAYSYTKGHLVVDSLPKHVVQHAPTKKTRMNTLKRDGFKCKVCGRSSKDYVDVELHAHHIFPWGKGGVTEEENLITLCHTCHDGLDPHFEISLFPLIDVDPIKERIRDARNKYIEGLRNYHKIVRSHLDK